MQRDIKIDKKIEDTNDLTFASLCSKYEKFRIPPYQRPYTWMPKNIDTLWEDMIVNDLGYFIGSAVFLEAMEETNNRVTIIDGQQRLITISLIVLALEKEWVNLKKSTKEAEKSKKIKNKIDKLRKSYLVYEEEIPNSPLEVKTKLRIKPDKNNLRKVYKDLIFNKINVDSKNLKEKYDKNQMRFIRNYKRVRTSVKSFVNSDDKKAKISKISDLSNKVLNLLVIAIMCDSENDAYKIFEGLNATGVGLTVSDLVKNAVLRAADEDDRNNIQNTWEEMESIFEDTKLSALPRYLRHQWISYEGYITRSKLFDEIKDKKIKGKSGSAIKRYSNKLLKDAKSYAGFRFDDYESELNVKSKKTFDAIKRFRFLNIKQVFEVLLAYYNKFLDTEHYSEKQFRGHIEDLWTFSFRGMIVNLNPSDYERVFAGHCEYINEFNEKNMSSMDSEFKNKLKKILENTEEKFVKKLSNELEYKKSTSRLIKYIFDTLIKNEDEGVTVREPTIEHILPQTPTKWGFEKSDVANFVNRIGNLTLLYKVHNQDLGNEIMEVKVKKVFSNSKLKMHKRISNLQSEFEEDPEEIIEKRSKEIAKKVNSMEEFKFSLG